MRGITSWRRAWSSAAFAVALFANVAAARTNLSGRVLGADGSPIGGATVFIYEAGPRSGVSPFCPSCYPDCGKHRTTELTGRFVVPSLSDSLVFRVLVIADGFEPKFVTRVDPTGNSLEVRLTARDTTKLDTLTTVRGRVVDPDGQPVVGATVGVFGIHGADRQTYGPVKGADPLAVTDGRGEFSIATQDSGARLYLEVHARGLAPRAFDDVPTGAARNVLALSRGGSLAGRVQKDGEPVPGIAVSVAPVNHLFWGFKGDTIATDPAGRFLFSNLPCNRDYVLAATMESLHRVGATPEVVATVGDEDSLTVAPPLSVGPGRHLAGRIVLTDGRPVPPGTRVTIGRHGDSRLILLDSEGRFDADGLPSAEVTLTVMVRGYHLSPRMPATWTRRDWTIAFAMLQDRRDLSIFLDPDAPFPTTRPLRPSP